MKYLFLLILRLYKQLISPYLATSCRFHPTCSVYAMEAIQQYGAIKGAFLAIKRISKCHPFHPGGCDPVP